jgi:hypothetical protein
MTGPSMDLATAGHWRGITGVTIKGTTVILRASEAGVSRHDGRTWTTVRVTIENRGVRKMVVAPPQFILRDKSGGEWSAKFSGGSLGQQNVAPGSSVSGTVGVPTALTPVAVSYLGDLFGSGDPITTAVD